MAAKGKLTDKALLFIDAYLGQANGNASKAAEIAGYKGDHANTGYRLKHDERVQAIIQQRLKENSLSADEVLSRLANIARGSMADFIADEGEVRLDLDKAKLAGRLALVKKLNIDEKGMAIELYDARAALVDIGRYHKLFTDRHEIVDLDEAIERELARLAAGGKEEVPVKAAGNGRKPPAPRRRSKDKA